MNASYIARAVRNAGVPPMWIEDAVQDVLVTLWRRGYEDAPRAYRVMVIRRAAIDAARKYGYHRRGKYRPVMLPLTVDMPYAHEVDERLDIERALLRVTAMQRAAFRRWWFGRQLSVNERALANAVKRRLRREAA